MQSLQAAPIFPAVSYLHWLTVNKILPFYWNMNDTPL
jgi:hypothetical protein